MSLFLCRLMQIFGEDKFFGECALLLFFTQTILKSPGVGFKWTGHHSELFWILTKGCGFVSLMISIHRAYSLQSVSCRLLVVHELLLASFYRKVPIKCAQRLPWQWRATRGKYLPCAHSGLIWGATNKAIRTLETWWLRLLLSNWENTKKKANFVLFTEKEQARLFSSFWTWWFSSHKRHYHAR